MVSKTCKHIKDDHATQPEKVIGLGIRSLIVLSLIPFASVEAWSTALLEIIIFLMLFVWILNDRKGFVFLFKEPLPAVLLTSIFGLIVIQVLPLPLHFIQMISPGYSDILPPSESAPKWITISLNSYETTQQFHLLAAFTALMYVVARYCSNKKRVESLILTIVYTAFGITIAAILNKFNDINLFDLFYPGELTIKPKWGPYINHNHFAAYLEMSFLFGSGVFLYRISRRKYFPGLSRMAKIARFVSRREANSTITLSIILLSLVAGILLSLSRGGILGLMGGGTCFILMTIKRHGLRKRARYLAFAGIVITSVVVLSGADQVLERFGQIDDLDRVKRIWLWSDSLRIIKDYPILGSGLGTFLNIYPKYQTHYSWMHFEHAENEYVEGTSEMGILGLLLVMALLCSLFRSLIRRWQNCSSIFVQSVVAGGISSMVAMLIHAATDFNLRIPGNLVTLAVIIGITSSVSVKYYKTSSGDDAI